MDPEAWEEMVIRTRELEAALGSTDKIIVENEKETSVIQRRCVRAARDLKAGEVITRDMLDVLRPATNGAIKPNEINAVIGTKVNLDIPAGKEIRWTDVV
jgi:N-acetylneuraminate synthase